VALWHVRKGFLVRVPAMIRSLAAVTARDAVLAVVSGLLGAVSFAPLGLWPGMLVSLALLLVLLGRQPTLRAGWQIGLIHGLIYGLGTMHWFVGLFGLMGLGLIGLMGLSFGLLGIVAALTRSYPPLTRAFLVGLAAVGLEWLRGDAWYLRFPWYTPAHALAACPVCIAWVHWLGSYGLSLLVWMILAGGSFGRRRIWLSLLLLPLGCLLQPEFAAPDQRALLVQREDRGAGPDRVDRLPHEKIDLVILPELAYFQPWDRVLQRRHGPVRLARELACPVVFGAPSRELHDPDMENVAVVLNSGGQVVGTFTKQHPVPLVHDGVPGSDRPVFPLEGEHVLGVAVCYDFDEPEVAASLVQQGATVLAAPTSDAQPWGRAQHLHHELLLRLRAVENDRWILRSASSGRTEVIDPHGYPSQQGVDIGGPGSVVVPFGHRHTHPLGGRLWVLGPAAAAALVFFVAAQTVQHTRQRRQRASLDDSPPAP
jgi:apolipoprotein N-acyltransferase